MKAKLTPRIVSKAEPGKTYYKIWDSELNGFFLRVMPSGIKSYCIYYRHNGLGREYTIGKHGKLTSDQARKQATIKLGELASGSDIQHEKKLARERTIADRHKSLGTFISDKYAPWLLSERKYSVEALKRIENNFSHLFSRNMPDIKPWDIQKWRTKKLKKGLKPSTLNRELMALKAVLSKAVEWDVIEANPISRVKPQKIDTKANVRFLSKVEESRLRKALDDRELKTRLERQSANEWRQARGYQLFDDLKNSRFADYLKPMVLVALNTGMRRGELFDLCWENVDFKNKSLEVAGRISKSGNTRHIPLNDEALGTLIAWRNQTDSKTLVFPNPTSGKRFDNIQTSWENLLNQANIQNFRFHDIRHHFASKLVMAGVDLNTVRELLGHSEISMTLRYSHLAPEHKATAVALLSN